MIIENPILNSPFVEPDRHFRFDEQGITSDVVSKRRTSSYFIPIAQPRKRGQQLQFETEWTQDRIADVARKYGDAEGTVRWLAETLESMSEVRCYVKNQDLNFTIPYPLNGR